MTQEEEITNLRAENQDLRAQLQAALARIEELERKAKEPPSFVKANVTKAKEKKVRKKRKPEENGARRREEPTQIVEHRIEQCPECGLRLGGISLARRRQVIEVPPPPPVEVIEHQVSKGWCSGCQKWREAPLDLHGQVVGQGRVGVRVASLIATLRTVLRVPMRQIQLFLKSVHGLTISAGEISELLSRSTIQMQAEVEAIKVAMRASPAVQADETGWRENGRHGYVWSANTPSLRYYEYHHSRGREVVKDLLGESFEGVLGSDFYAAYNIHQGLHQRCWVHFLRDIHELKKLHPDDAELWQWAKEVKQVYECAKAAQAGDAPLPATKQHAQRVTLQHACEQELWQVCAPYAHTQAPMHTLCERVERFLPELFVFVAYPGVPSHNNLAERSVRPLVITRKISGGTRSPQGSQTRMGLASLFGTWMAQGLNPFFQCLSVLSSKSSLGQF
jgi:transposase